MSQMTGTEQMRAVFSVCLNPSLDIAIELPVGQVLKPHALNRYRNFAVAAGGKGLNVARQLAATGLKNTLFIALPEAATGLQAYFSVEAFATCTYRVPGEVRINLKLHEHAASGEVQMTELNGFGSPLERETAADLSAMLFSSVANSNVAVFAGSLLPGIPNDIFARAAGISRKCGGITILDAAGQVATPALEKHIDIYKPNRAELAEATGLPCTSIKELAVAAAAFCRHGKVQLLLCSLGEEGAILTTGNKTFYAAVPGHSSPVLHLAGAGDAMTAALATFAATTPPDQSFSEHLAQADLPALLRRAMAMAQATIRCRTGETPTWEAVLDQWQRVQVEPLNLF